MTYNYEQIKKEFYESKDYGVFIDDTGSPGLAQQGGLNPNRKTWVSVIIPPNQIIEVLEQMPEALQELERQFGAKEFHFKDIFQGKNKFKNVDPNIRLSLVGFMSEIFYRYKFPILVQTLNPEDIVKIKQQSKLLGSDITSTRIPNFDFNKVDAFSLFFLLFNTKKYLESNRASKEILASIFIDEGFRKKGAEIKIQRWDAVFREGKIRFASSEILLPLQLADFAAFCLNRTQLIINKNEMTDFDKTFLKICSDFQNNYQNIVKISINL